MCGISGQVGWAGVGESRVVEGLTGEQRHRGPDDTGKWTSPDGRCVLGHNRLSIIDLSRAGHQPMIDPLTGNAVVFNGEIYNFQELRKQCEEDGDRFHSRSDTEVILALYRKHGPGCLGRLRGMFAFALWDAAQGELFLARDRVGKKPLHYALTPRGLIFSSEIDPLARRGGLDLALDDEALALFLQLQYIPAPWTIYRAIRKLPPAHYAVVGPGGVEFRNYWDVSYRDKARLSESEALDGLEEKLGRAVKLRLISDVPLGALLSGGVDSGLIVALMSKLGGAPVRTFSIGFEEKRYNELAYAGMVAERYRTEHTPEIVKGEVAPLLDGIARRYGEPFADPSAVPTFHVCRAARRHVTVALTGDGGDELLGGYDRYKLGNLSVASGTLLGRFLSPEAQAGWISQLFRDRPRPARLMRRFVTAALHPELLSFHIYMDLWNDPDRERLLATPAGAASRLLHGWRKHWLEGGMKAAGNPVDRMLWMDNRTYLPGNLLVKMDIASMHCGLEARSPLLDHEVIEFCASLPARMKVRNGTGKYLLKKLGERYLPREILCRPKMGFGIPLDEWLRTSLAPLADEVLADEEAMHPLRVPVLRETLDGFLHHGRNWGMRVWTALMYGIWNRQRPNS